MEPRTFKDTILPATMAYSSMFLAVVAGTSKFISPGSIGAAAITQAAMQAFLYCTKTPKNEFSKGNLLAQTVVGGCVGVAAEGMSCALHRMPDLDETIRKAAIQAGIAAYTEIIQGLVKMGAKERFGPDDQDLTMGKVVKAAAGGAVSSLTSSVIEEVANAKFGDVDTFKRFILQEATKNGLGAAMGTFIRNAYVEYDGVKIDKIELLRAMVLGSVLGAAGATLQRALPAEVEAKADEIEKATREYDSLRTIVATTITRLCMPVGIRKKLLKS